MIIKDENEAMRNPLVSIIVITYNSSKYVLETLESAKAQTYENIELIVSDDCSADDTVEICRDWIAQNEDRFVRTKLLTVPENTGIPANCNRGVKAAKGEWVKLIAGDDVLMEDCIENYIDYVNDFKEVNFCYSDYVAFFDTLNNENIRIDSNTKTTNLQLFSELPSKYQNKVLQIYTPIPAFTFFFKKNAFQKINFFDETYTFLEDWTTFYNITLHGNKFYYLNKKTVYYRLQNNSITKIKIGQFPTFHKNIIKVIDENFYNSYNFIDNFLFRCYKFYINKYQNETPKLQLAVILQRFLYISVILLEKRREATIPRLHKKLLHK